LSGRITRSGTAFRAQPWTGPEPAGGWRAVFEVFASESPTAPGLLGSYRREGDAIVFTPRFAPSPEVRLRAVLRPLDGEPAIAWFGGVPAPQRAPTTRVLSVTPSADVWPENILRLYVTFSAPMRLGVAWDNLKMLDAAGRPMGGMFVEVDQELWDPAGRRLTVLFDPARIKRGLVDHINEGPPFVVGQRATLQIEPYWRDSAGGLLADPFEKQVTIAPPLRAALGPADWRLTPPRSASAPLVVDFPHPLDAAIAARALTVRRGGARIAGAAQLEASETRFVFTPDTPWTRGAYALVADAVLEDIAGNRIGRPFDIDRREPALAQAEACGAEIEFEVGA
jgi:hypothetical protein